MPPMLKRSVIAIFLFLAAIASGYWAGGRAKGKEEAATAKAVALELGAADQQAEAKAVTAHAVVRERLRKALAVEPPALEQLLQETNDRACKAGVQSGPDCGAVRGWQP